AVRRRAPGADAVRRRPAGGGLAGEGRLLRRAPGRRLAARGKSDGRLVCERDLDRRGPARRGLDRRGFQRLHADRMSFSRGIRDMSERNDTDAAQQVANDLRARLRGMASDEVIELCAQLLSTYVIEGVLPLSRAGESSDLASDAAGEESFAQMLKRLKAAKKDPVLERFFIDGENISVRIDGQGILPITDYRRPTGPPRAAGVSIQAVPLPRRESVPGAASSIYNR